VPGFIGIQKIELHPPTPNQLTAIVDAWAMTIDELHELDPPAAEATRFRRI